MAILQKRLTWNRQANAVILTKRNRIQWCLYSCCLRLLCQKRNKLRLPNKRPSAITASFELPKVNSALGTKLNQYGRFCDQNLSFQIVLKTSLSFCLKDKSPKSFESKYKITTARVSKFSNFNRFLHDQFFASDSVCCVANKPRNKGCITNHFFFRTMHWFLA